MSSLSPEAYAVIEGRQSDPFRIAGIQERLRGYPRAPSMAEIARSGERPTSTVADREGR